MSCDRSTDPCDQVACLAHVPGPYVYVDVFDAVSGEHAAEGARGHVRQGDRVDSLHACYYGSNPPVVVTLCGGWLPGPFTVTIEKKGYIPWSVGNITLTAGCCGYGEVWLTADLVPETARGSP